eukprot:NODE_896_length_2261_cov_141.354069_g763_i0.p1 GENE.NODE_896_length_2261_cov_141.354069_g763_i0~~NODE_896_length_2261_cov_141.354069_g763_i0.p1  ORF type:complete len:583 (-),score=105.69 NODE_896_length_2261_cov_141.354069_g763_i0:402-2150(-)
MSVFRSGSLYVGDLHPDVTEAMLFDEFKAVGPIMSIRVCRDAVTRRSLGYAYVNFQNTLDAERCLDTLNYTKFRNRACRIMWSQRNPILRKNNSGNIFIKNLARNIDHKSLHDTFSVFGPILSCKVVYNDKGVSAGYGFVHFESEASAKEAIAKVDGMLLNSEKVFVGPFVRRAKGLEDKYTNLYVKHLNPVLTTDELREAFGKYGEIRSCLIVPKEEGPNAPIFAYVCFEEHEQAVKAVEALHDSSLEQNGIGVPDKSLYVARHQRKSERQALRDQWARERQLRLAKYVNLYVKNLDDSVTSEQLLAMFKDFGTVISAKVMVDPTTGLSKGFGFVSYQEPEAANKAVAEMNNKWGICSKPLYVGPAQTKDARRQQLELQFSNQRNNMPTNNRPQSIFPTSNLAGQPMASFQNAIPPQGVRGPRGFTQPPNTNIFPYNQPKQPMPSGPFFMGAMPRGPIPQPKPITTQVTQPAWLEQKVVPKPAPVVVKEEVDDPPAVTREELRKMSSDEAKNALGEMLYSTLVTTYPELAAKITGMLLEMDNQEIFNLLENPISLQGKVKEALDVLHRHPDELKAAREAVA